MTQRDHGIGLNGVLITLIVVRTIAVAAAVANVDSAALRCIMLGRENSPFTAGLDSYLQEPLAAVVERSSIIHEQTWRSDAVSRRWYCRRSEMHSIGS